MKTPKSNGPEKSAIKVLLTDTNRWALAARLAVGLSEVGCDIAALCPMPNHPLLKTRAVRKTYHYSGLRPIASLTEAIERFNPDIVVPSCDRGVRHLHELYARSRKIDGKRKIAELIERSLGDPRSYPIVSSRYELLSLARDLGVRVPRTSRANHPEELTSWQSQESFPWVLKADGTWGGGGVKVIEAPGQVEDFFTQLDRMFRLRRAFKRLTVNRDAFWLRPWWNRPEPQVIAQSYIYGRPANCAVVCWNGRVLAGFGVEVVNSEGLTGPASVVRVVDNQEMMSAAEKIASRLSLSGFFGLDFMIEEKSGHAYLIEMNPRVTPLCHLRLGEGRDMVNALWAELSGQPAQEAMPDTENELIAYFPETHETELPQACFLDVPRGEPELMQELLNPWPNRTLLYRMVNRMGKKSPSLMTSKELGKYSVHNSSLS